MLREDIKLLTGDCLDILSRATPNSVDAIVTDPPYGIGFDYGTGKKDVASDPHEYWKWFQPIYQEMIRILKPGGFLAIWQAQLYFSNFWDWFGDDIHIYCAAKNFVQLRKTAINYGYDPVVMKYKQGKQPLRPNKPKRNIDFFVANTAAHVSKPDSLARKHPCPRPLDQVVEIVSNFCLPGGLIVDPFMGSGTTGLAAKMLGYSFIGIEREPEYVEIAQARIAAV